jgi:membrane-bound lytic murein transglycosylase D
MQERGLMRRRLRVSNDRVVVVILGFWLAACSTVAPRPSTPERYPQVTQPRYVPPSEPIQDKPGETVSEAPEGASFDTSHPAVEGFVERYQTKWRTTLDDALARGSLYMPDVRTILATEGVPSELAYLPVVESRFRLDAVSGAGAAGPWQFMQRTARRYGLRVDKYVDERHDVEKSTRAAAHYLRDLYDMFGDWLLTLAAYNAGEGTIARLQERRQLRNFWDMSEKGHLSRETSDFIPRFLAVLEIVKEPVAYGFELPEESDLAYEQVDIEQPLPLRAAAELVGCDLTTMKQLNPALRRDTVPGGYFLRLPEGTLEQFELAYEQLRERGLEHRVRRGETPASIARMYGVPISDLMRTNGIRNPRRLKVGAVLTIPPNQDDIRRIRRLATQGSYKNG